MEKWDNVKIFPDRQAVIQYAAERIARIATATLEVNDVFTIALSGGSTPYPVYEILGARLSHVFDWERIHIWWGDERCVLIDDAESNYHNTRESLLKYIEIPEANIHRIRGEDDPHEAAKAYDKEVRDFFKDGEEYFDLNILGMGEDGHTAGLFPNTDALNENDKLYIAHHVKAKGNMWRITQTYPTIDRSSNIMFLVTGEGKADALKQVMQGEENFSLYPSQKIARSNHPYIVWVLDEAAASKLD